MLAFGRRAKRGPWRAPLPIARLWGVGRKTQPLLERAGLRTIGDVQQKGRDELIAAYGAMLMEGLGVMGCKRSGRGQACEPLRVQHLRSTGAVPVMGYLKNHLSSADKAYLR